MTKLRVKVYKCKLVYLQFVLSIWTNAVTNFQEKAKLRSFYIVSFRFSIFVMENLEFKWQFSQYLDLNPTCATAH